MYHFYYSSEFNSESKTDTAASRVSTKEAVREEDDEEEFLEELSDDDDDVDEQEVDNELGLVDEDDYEVSLTPEQPPPTDEAEKSVRVAMTIWQHYRPWLVTNVARVAYLCSPHPLIIAHSEDNANKDPENAIAVEQFIERVIVPQKCSREENCSMELARMV
jgi:hypothetical protein